MTRKHTTANLPEKSRGPEDLQGADEGEMGPLVRSQLQIQIDVGTFQAEPRERGAVQPHTASYKWLNLFNTVQNIMIALRDAVFRVRICSKFAANFL